MDEWSYAHPNFVYLVEEKVELCNSPTVISLYILLEDSSVRKIVTDRVKCDVSNQYV